MNRRQFVQSTASMGLLAATMPSRAQSEALDNVRILVGFAPGGTIDVISRQVASKLAGTAFSRTEPIVENRAGASGQLACVALKAAAADGRTLLCTSSSTTTIYPHIYKKLGYNAFTDFAPVSTAATASLALAVGPAVPMSVQSVADYVRWMQADSSRATYGTPGSGTSAHFLGALLGIRSGLAYTQIPYKGSSPGIADLLGGQVPAMFTVVGDFLPNHQSGKIRILATSAPRRTPFTPKVASFDEQGLPELTAEETLGFYMPAATPPALIMRANEAIRAALSEASLIESLAQRGISAGGSTPTEMAARQQSEYARWGEVVKRIGFTPES
jgi:tripartite-type tricarboxylate transporter receptor subunit TctC